MQLLIEILKVLSLNGFLISLLFLFNKKGNARANRLYASLVFILTAIILENMLILSGDIFKYPHFFSVATIGLLLIPPILYFLHLSLLEPEKKLKVGHILLHLLPFFLCLISMFDFFMASAEVKLYVLESIYLNHQRLEGPTLIYSALNILQFIAYNLTILKSLKAKSSESTQKSLKLRLSWFNLLLLGINVLLITYVFLYISFIYFTQFQTLLIIIFTLLMLCCIYVSSIFLIRNPFYFSDYHSLYKGPQLSAELIEDLGENLYAILEKEKPYLKARLKLGELAGMLGVSTHQLSQYLNQVEGESFSRLINAKRMSHAKALLAEDPHKKLTILGIALDSGFSTQAHFIKVFKEATELTPSQYRQKHAQDSIPH